MILRGLGDPTNPSSARSMWESLRSPSGSTPPLVIDCVLICGVDAAFSLEGTFGGTGDADWLPCSSRTSTRSAMLATRRVVPALSLIVAAIPSQERQLGAVEERYSKTEVMIPARDGVRLYTEIYTPVDAQGDRPIIFLRTPYRTADPGGGFTRYFGGTFRVLQENDYIFAVQDARGRFGSEGTFEWNRPIRHRADPNAIDASTDAWDSIDWLTKHVPDNNGRVGMLGVSYPGWYVAMALIDPHPALKAASPQASPSDYFIGDDFFHYGAFRLSPSIELPYLFDFDPKQNSRFPYDQVDTYEFFLDLGPLANVNARYLRDASPTWNHFMAHASYDGYWQAGGTLQHFDRPLTVPTLNVVGWWDAENLGGALDLYAKLESVDAAGQNWLVVGPWSHGQWGRARQTALGAYEFGSDTSEYYQRELEAPWFAYHLEDSDERGQLDQPEATMFQTGTNRWQTFSSWPPTPTVTRRLYLRAGGALDFDAPPADDSGVASFVSDPAKPVPYTKRPIMGFWSGMRGSSEPRFGRAGVLWKVEDQRFVSDRPDVLSFVTEPLTDDLEVTGRIVARLFTSTTGTDADWVVKLIDVYPEDYAPRPEMGGYQLMIADDVFRAKFRNGFDRPEPIEPGAVTPIEIDLRTRHHCFRNGHRIMVQVQSTWFPLIDRNPQTFVDIPSASEADFGAAEHRIHTSPEAPSHVEIQIRGR